MEEPLYIDAGDETLFGLLHTPDAGRARAAILMVNSRVEYRVGPHRFYVRAARALAERGFAVLRLDHPGNGDSTGDAEYAHMDSFPVAPAVSGIELLENRLGGVPVVALGLCMGARNALYAAAACPTVRHLVAFGMPFSDATPDILPDANTESQTIGTTVARNTMQGYLQRLGDPVAWRRLLTGQTDYGVIRRALPAALGLGRGRIFKEPVFRSLDSLLSRGGQIEFVFGTHDVFWPDFEEQFERVRSRLPQGAAACTLDFVPDANHTFSRVVWQDAAIEHATRWLEARFPEPQSEAA